MPISRCKLVIRRWEKRKPLTIDEWETLFECLLNKGDTEDLKDAVSEFCEIHTECGDLVHEAYNIHNAIGYFWEKFYKCKDRIQYK